jgi:Flp pilus assembly protein TadG
MTRPRARMAAEHGLVGKILALWLVVLVLIGIAAYDGVQIALARYRASDAAQTAAFEAASSLRTTHDRRVALDAAETVADDKDVKITGFRIDATTGQVTVTVQKGASTLVLGKLLFEDLALATAKSTSEPDTGG